MQHLVTLGWYRNADLTIVMISWGISIARMKYEVGKWHVLHDHRMQDLDACMHTSKFCMHIAHAMPFACNSP